MRGDGSWGIPWPHLQDRARLSMFFFSGFRALGCRIQRAYGFGIVRDFSGFMKVRPFLAPQSAPRCGTTCIRYVDHESFLNRFY